MSWLPESCILLKNSAVPDLAIVPKLLIKSLCVIPIPVSVMCSILPSLSVWNKSSLGHNSHYEQQTSTNLLRLDWQNLRLIQMIGVFSVSLRKWYNKTYIWTLCYPAYWTGGSPLTNLELFKNESYNLDIIKVCLVKLRNYNHVYNLIFA